MQMEDRLVWEKGRVGDSMNLVTIEHLTKSYTERLLFEDTEFSIQEGEKIGLIGINGTGKSTLLKIVAGMETLDLGTMAHSRNLDIRYLPQNPGFVAEDTIMERTMKAILTCGIWKAKLRLC